jgi:hypothetical protein
MDALEVGMTMLIVVASVGIAGITAMLSFGFGAKIYSNIRQMLLERESSEDVQK